ncbi:MAG: dihydroorotase [Bacteroidia bacterium]
MTLLGKSAILYAPNHPGHLQRLDIFIENGIITRIADNIEAEAHIRLEADDLCVSPGWMDMQVDFSDPGNEYREDLESGTEAAAYGGMTTVALFPETVPPLDAKSQIQYIKGKTAHQPVTVLPVGTISKGMEGIALSEMLDMYNAGAVAFGDGTNGLTNSGLLLKALMYVKSFDGVVMVHPEDPAMAPEGLMNEGVVNTRLGLAGIPSIAEETAVAKAISLAEYSGSRLHFTTLSTSGSVELVREAKKNGVKITAGVSVFHLNFNESALEEFDTNLKLRPPLRPAKDCEALRKAVREGVIDVVVSNHQPKIADRKNCEFALAATGAIGIQTLFPMVLQAFGTEDLSWLTQLMSMHPRKVLGLEQPLIEQGAKADLTFFSPSSVWKFNATSNKSKSCNTPLWETELKGRALAIANRGQVKYLD